MWVKQMSVEDWHELFLEHAKSQDQIELIRKRQEWGLELATWERNALRAYEKLTKNS
jgi:hypothetical protein